MQKKGLLDNKGFSLVELIIVIAIMAILVGVMAPNLLRYVEKTNVSADVQLADSVRMAIQYGMLDPSVINAGDDSVDTFTTAHKDKSEPLSTGLEGELLKSVCETLGYADDTTASGLIDELREELRSAHEDESTFNVEITGSNKITIEITDTDADGKKETEDGPNIMVPAESAASPAPTTT